MGTKTAPVGLYTGRVGGVDGSCTPFVVVSGMPVLFVRALDQHHHFNAALYQSLAILPRSCSNPDLLEQVLLNLALRSGSLPR